MELAAKALKDGRNIADALNILDFTGSEEAEQMLLQITLMRQRDPTAKVTKMLRLHCNQQAISPGGKENRGQIYILL